MSLFKNNKPAYHQWELELGHHKRAQKVAEEMEMGDNSDNWQTEVASVANSSLPYLSDYAVNVTLDKVNPDSNSAYGNLDIKTKFDAPSINKDNRSVQVPLIIDNKKLKPLDLMNIEGKMFPLSEARLKQALFRPEVAELSDRYPSKDRYIGYQASPPYGGGFGGFSYGESTGIGKYASILEDLAISEEDQKALAVKLANEPLLQKRFNENPAFARCIEKIADYEAPTELPDVTCIRFDKLNTREVLVKWASVRDFNPQTVKLSTAEAAQFAGQGESADQIFALEPGGSLTLTTNSAKKDTLDQDEVKEITEFGEYNVQDVEDRDLFGWVIPLISLDGEAVPSYIFTNGSVWALQDRISGSRVGQGANLPSHNPSGFGMFYSTDSGRVLGTLPVEVSHTEGDMVVCQDQLGAQLTLERLDIQAIVKLDEGHYAIPSTMKFLRLPQEFVALKSDGATFNKTACEDWTILTKHADFYSLRGYLTEQVPHEELSKEDTEFMLSTAGFDGEELVKRASKGVVKIAGGTQLQKVAIGDELKRRALIERSARNELVGDRLPNFVRTHVMLDDPGPGGTASEFSRKDIDEIWDHGRNNLSQDLKIQGPTPNYHLKNSPPFDMDQAINFRKQEINSLPNWNPSDTHSFPEGALKGHLTNLHNAKMTKLKNVGKGALAIGGLAGAAYGGKKLYDHFKSAEELREELTKIDVVKLASTFSDEETVDKILSLGVLNSDNLSKFSDYLPEFEKVEQKLAELLFGIRCGLSPVEEENAQLAMGHISKLIGGLRDLKEKRSLQNRE